MKLRTRAQSLPTPNGFSMVELMVVVALIVVMAAVGLPNLMGYLRQAKVRGAMQQVAGEMQAARNKAITKNTTSGVAFAVIDADTYRFFISDAPGSLGPIRQLPQGVTFVPAALPGFAFNPLGGACEYGPGCLMPSPPPTAVLCPTPDENRLCNDRSPGSYVSQVGGSFVVDMIENTTQLTRRIEVAPGGRVVTQR
jgi:prepilin-type N-terminal cleavage/methylation domain-containing protein